MDKIFIKYCIGTYVYGVGRTVVYAPPLKKEDYITDRIKVAILSAVTAPFALPNNIYTDLKNLEHVVRKMPGPINRRPW
jgi:hypothetical protein